MFCSNCGSEIDNGAKFCSNCGHNINQNEQIKEQSVETSQQKENKNFAHQIFSFLGSLIIIAVLFNLFGIFDIFSLSSTNEGKSNNLEVIESHSCDLGYGVRAICGTVKNNSSRNIGYAQVEINLYDKNGNIIDSTMDNINNLEGNATWKFQAPIIQPNIASFRIKNVTGF